MKKNVGYSIVSRIFSIVLCAAMMLTYFPLLERGEGKAYALDPTQGDSITFTPYSSDYVLDRDVFCYEDEESNKYRGSLNFRDGDKITIRENGEERTYTFLDYSFYDEDDNSIFVWNVGYEGAEIESGSYEFTIEYEGASDTFNINVIPHPIKEISYERVRQDYTEVEMQAYKHTVDGESYWTLPFLEGDRLTIKWSDEKKNDSIYTYKNNKFIDNNNQEIEADKIRELRFSWDEKVDIYPINGPYDFYGGYEDKAFSVDINVSDSSVQSVVFEPVVRKYTDVEMKNLCERGDEGYSYNMWFNVGDKLRIKLKDGSEKIYTYKQDAIKEVLDGKEHSWDGFVTENNETIWEEAVQLSYHSGTEEIVADRSYEFTASYRGVKSKVSISVIASPIESIKYEPSKRVYSEAELILHEMIYQVSESEKEYYYRLPFNYGDKLTIDWRDSKKETTTFIFKKNGLTWKEGSSTCYEDAFVDETGKVEPISNSRISYPSCDTNYRLSVENSPCTFALEYQNYYSEFNIDITRSSEAEKALSEDKNHTFDELEKIDNKYDINGKIDRKELRPAQEQESYNAWAKANTAIKNAKNKAELDKIVATYEADIKAIKTDAQLKAEEAAAKAAAAKKAAAELAEWNGILNKTIPAVKSANFKGAKKKITVKWKKADKKNIKKFDKVEIQICPNNKFLKANTKRILVSKTKKSSTIKGLKKGTYYVRVRNVKGSGAKKLVSKWSKVKKIKVK